MLSDEKGPAKFYCNFKVHKPHEPNTAPPVRPIVSGSGSTTENIAAFVEYHIKDDAKKHKSFLEDTPDFLRHIEQLNNELMIEDDAILVTWDVVGLYTNIPHDEGLQTLFESLEKILMFLQII